MSHNVPAGTQQVASMDVKSLTAADSNGNGQLSPACRAKDTKMKAGNPKMNGENLGWNGENLGRNADSKDSRQTSNGDVRLAGVEEYDYVHLTVYDLHTRAKGRLIRASMLPQVASAGMGMYAGICFTAINGLLTKDGFGERHRYGNLNMMPDMSTLAPCLGVTSGQRRIGQVICDMAHLDGTKDLTCPRVAALHQLSRLRERGLTMLCGVEMEFTLTDLATGQGFGHTNQFTDMNVLCHSQDLLLDFMEDAQEMGISLTTLQVEEGVGAFEFTTDPMTGIEAIDVTARLRNAMDVFFKSRGYQVSFMTMQTLDPGTATVQQLNHSLWTADGQNALHDSSDPQGLSKVARHWLAGLVHHGPALTAFGLPTVNCYSSFVQLEMPRVTPQIPRDLRTALSALQEDAVMVQALGPDLVQRFVHCKTTHEIQVLQTRVGDSREEIFGWERDMYFSRV
ncbi:lengsin [Aplysia californica]|uniref:Lengsin n=1 Tax=Aplysia californica TaxID=6500 RepID=A0ABM0ZYF8_APLCA|nr:lengsin [Aplysia californica]